ncbi:nuclear transport factor 2 family protein [Streptomyces sp. NPDC056480]|uniref:nuclear transport factor 2 family protein n=1 Tax=Streptomyces sp. NPDC056480 TaxID=3345833 RepID=UPI003680FA30
MTGEDHHLHARTMAGIAGAVRRGQIEKALDYYLPDAVFEETALGHAFHGRAAITKLFSDFVTAIEGPTFTVVSSFGSGRHAVFQWVMSGTRHSLVPQLPDRQAAHREFTLQGASVCLFNADYRIARETVYWNPQAMGPSPAPPSGTAH